MMPIQRQGDQYEALNGSGLRWAKEYESRDLPEGLIDAVSRGFGVTAGLNDPRGMARRATYGPEQPYGPPGPAVPPSYHHDDEAAENRYFHDQEFGLSREAPLEDGAYREEPRQQVEPLDHTLEGRDIPTLEVPADYDAQFGPHMASFGEAHLLDEDGPAQERTALQAPVISPQIVPGWVGHGFAPAHRVGLSWRDQIIPGTVTHLDGQEVGVRWDDGQHSTEEPSNLRPL